MCSGVATVVYAVCSHYRATENAEVEKSGANRRAGKCRSWVAVWEAKILL